MATQTKTLRDLENYLDGAYDGNRLSKFSHPNTYSFKNMAKFISSLHDKGIVNDEDFYSLLLYACSIFVENEVNEKIHNVLKKKRMPLF